MTKQLNKKKIKNEIIIITIPSNGKKVLRWKMATFLGESPALPMNFRFAPSEPCNAFTRLLLSAFPVSDVWVLTKLAACWKLYEQQHLQGGKNFSRKCFDTLQLHRPHLLLKVCSVLFFLKNVKERTNPPSGKLIILSAFLSESIYSESSGGTTRSHIADGHEKLI